MWERNFCRARGEERSPDEEELSQRLRIQVEGSSGLWENSFFSSSPALSQSTIAWRYFPRSIFGASFIFSADHSRYVYNPLRLGYRATGVHIWKDPPQSHLFGSVQTKSGTNTRLHSSATGNSCWGVRTKRPPHTKMTVQITIPTPDRYS